MYGHLSSISRTIQIRHAEHCWRRASELISDILLWTPSHGGARVGQPAITYIQQLCTDTGCSMEELLRTMDNRDKWCKRVRESVLAACHDDDDFYISHKLVCIGTLYMNIHIYIFFYMSGKYACISTADLISVDIHILSMRASKSYLCLIVLCVCVCTWIFVVLISNMFFNTYFLMLKIHRHTRTSICVRLISLFLNPLLDCGLPQGL